MTKRRPGVTTYVQQADGSLVRKEGHAGAPALRSPMIMRDLAPYESMITGEQITSRSRHRQHLRDHGCIEIGSETPPAIRERQYEQRHRRGRT